MSASAFLRTARVSGSSSFAFSVFLTSAATNASLSSLIKSFSLSSSLSLSSSSPYSPEISEMRVSFASSFASSSGSSVFLHERERQDVAYPAFLDFLLSAIFLFYHHVGIYLLCRFKSLRLDYFKIHGDFLPVVVKQLVCAVFVYDRNSCEAGGKFLCSARLLPVQC